MQTLRFCLLSALIFLACYSREKSVSETVADSEYEWNSQEEFFKPPLSFKDKLGDFRSPLNFYDGRQVQSAADWPARREEILSVWQGYLGEWPHLLVDRRMERIDSVRRDNFTQFGIRLEWIPGEFTQGYLLVPDGISKGPAVVNVYYEPETGIGLGRPYRDYAYQLARRGFVTLSLGTTEATEKKTYALYYPRLDSATVQPLSMLACAAANAWHALAGETFVDSTRIGIVGHSFGGKWAMFASCLFDQYACAVWSDPGIVFDESRPSVNYWEPWYLGYHPPPWRERGIISETNPAHGLYPHLRQQGFNLTDLHALMAPRPFLVSGGSEDPPERWLALNHTLEVYNLLGKKLRVGMTNRSEHAPDSASNAVVYRFFQDFLQREVNTD